MMPCAPFADPLLVDDAAELLPTLFLNDGVKVGGLDLVWSKLRRDGPVR
jgi:hypothetical protein